MTYTKSFSSWFSGANGNNRKYKTTSCGFSLQEVFFCYGFGFLFCAFERFDHVDLLVLARDHQTDEQRYAEGQQDRYAVGQRSEHELHLIFARERCQEPLQYADACGKSDQHADDGQPDVLGDQQPSDITVAKTEHFQRRQLSGTLDIAHQSEVVQHDDTKDDGGDHQNDDHSVHNLHKAVEGVHELTLVLLACDQVRGGDLIAA